MSNSSLSLSSGPEPFEKLATRQSPTLGPYAPEGTSRASGTEVRNYSVLEPLRMQRRITHALLMREILTRYGRHNIGFLWLFIDPMIFTGLIALVWSAMRTRHFDSISVVAFAVTGYSTVILWRTMVSRCIDAVEPNRALLFHRPVKVLDFYFARILLEAAGATISFVLLAALFTMFDLMQLPKDPLKVALGWFLLAWFGASLSLAMGSLSEVSPLVEKIWAPISYISFMFSGAMFMLDMLPAQMRYYMLWVPMVSGVEYLREGYFGPVVRFYYDLGYLVTWNLALLLFGLWQIHLMRRRITVE